MNGALLRGILTVAVLGVLVAGISLLPSREFLPPTRTDSLAATSTPEQPVPNFIEVVDSCGAHYEGTCVSVRSGPSTDFPTILRLRTRVVLPIASTTVTDANGMTWYQIAFSEWIRYPDRVPIALYVAAPYVRAFTSASTEESMTPRPSLLEQAKKQLGIPSGKRIIVDRSEQTLYAYDGTKLFLKAPISTGLDLTPTPRGTFTVYRKTPSRYMQGPLPGISDEYYDLPGVPWNMYFTNEGGAIHGAYWHTAFGTQWSHGCVNLPLDTARTLYEWTPIGTPVLVQD